MLNLQETIEQTLAEFTEREEHSGELTIGEFVYRLVMAGVHELMTNIAQYMDPMGKVTIEDRSIIDDSQDPLFQDMDAPVEEQESTEDE